MLDTTCITFSKFSGGVRIFKFLTLSKRLSGKDKTRASKSRSLATRVDSKLFQSTDEVDFRHCLLANPRFLSAGMGNYVGISAAKLTGIMYNLPIRIPQAATPLTIFQCSLAYAEMRSW